MPEARWVRQARGLLVIIEIGSNGTSNCVAIAETAARQLDPRPLPPE
jgi:hypothetical protein